MTYLRSAAFFLVVAGLAIGCVVSPNASNAPGPSPVPSVTARTTGAPPSEPVSSPASRAGVALSPDVEVVYAGADATMELSAFPEGGKSGSSGPLAIAVATVDYGDGVSASVSQDCASPALKLELQHAYRMAGDFTLTVTSAELCERNWQLDLDTGEGIGTLAAAPASTAGWLSCMASQIKFGGGWSGAGLGNEAALVRLTNISKSGCNLMGYPSLRLVSGDHALLPTHVHHAFDGDYMFPSIAVGRVALGPGEVAAFLVGYPGTPFGDAANEPYDIACPAAPWIRVTLPNSRERGIATVPMAPCGGVVSLSPIYPGDQHIGFPGA